MTLSLAEPDVDRSHATIANCGPHNVYLAGQALQLLEVSPELKDLSEGTPGDVSLPYWVVASLCLPLVGGQELASKWKLPVWSYIFTPAVLWPALERVLQSDSEALSAAFATRRLTLAALANVLAVARNAVRLRGHDELGAAAGRNKRHAEWTYPDLQRL